MSDPVIVLKVGDSVIIHGHNFILTNYVEEINQPARVKFKQPVEFMNTFAESSNIFEKSAKLKDPDD